MIQGSDISGIKLWCIPPASKSPAPGEGIPEDDENLERRAEEGGRAMGPAQGSMAPGAAQLMSLTSSFLVFAQEERSTETVEELLLDLCGEADLNGARGSA